MNEASPTAPSSPPHPAALAGDEPTDLRRIAEDLVTEAAAHLAGLPRPWDERGGEAAGVATKSTPTDVVTASDHALEVLIRDRIAAVRPGDAVVGEEHGSTAGDSRTVWVVDPIDGTVNFLYGLPEYAVSLAAEVDGASVAGVVINAATGVEYAAAKGLGATRDGTPLSVRGVPPVPERLVLTGFGYESHVRARQAANVARLLPQVRDVRRMGSCALDLCHVAEGTADGYVEEGPHRWDWAAGRLVAEESGARFGLLPGTAGRQVVVAAPRAGWDDFVTLLIGCGFVVPEAE